MGGGNLFTGIVEEIGKIAGIQKGAKSAVLTIQAEKVLEDVHIGDSIAVNGVCLTVTSFEKNTYTADVMNETLQRSSLGSLSVGSSVNLERAMAANGRFGGHIVSGHIDGTGTICEVKSDEIAVCYSIKAPEKIMHYIVEKGSVAVDGISLTVAKTTQTTFMVSVIPHTAQCTVLAYKKAGDTVNLENDCIGKYIEHFLNWEKEKTTESKITREFLFSNGF